MEPLCITLAKEMLDMQNFSGLPKELEHKLLEAERLIQKAKPNGCLSSTQTIATIILQWEMEETIKLIIDDDDAFMPV